MYQHIIKMPKWPFLVALWVMTCIGVFNKYAYEIENLNARARTFIIRGHVGSRVFDENGLPLTIDARTGRKFISPFYVVHYGLINSELFEVNREDERAWWRNDESLKYWDFPPKDLSLIQFKKNADWVVDNAKQFHGRTHLVYDFDWRYKNYPNGELRAPWWSGLTDGYAIILMLRAYDAFNEEKYLKLAGDFYNSVATKIPDGGSLSILNGTPWIEEYVDPSVDPKNMSFVLNGMIYAYRGVSAYEDYMKLTNGISPRLLESISKNINVFDMGKWSYYDAIGTAANIKYHNIHVALLSDEMGLLSKDRADVLRRWKVGAKNPGFFWVSSPGMSVSKAQFIVTLIISIFTLPVIVYLFKIKAMRRITDE